jgi:hypothetical protein
MTGLLLFVLAILVSPFRSRSRLEAENAALRHQLMVLRRKVQGRVRLPALDVKLMTKDQDLSFQRGTRPGCKLLS